MKAMTCKSLGLNVNLSVPATYAEFDSLAKKENAALDEAIKNVVYRGTLAEFRDVLLHGRKADTEKGITAITGMDDLFKAERKTKPVLDKAGAVKKNAKGEELTAYDETEEEFFDRIVAANSITEADQQKLADVVASQLVFDPSATERKPAAPKKLAAKYVENAKKLIAGGKIDELNKRLSKAINKTFTPVTTLTDGQTQEQLDAANAETLGWLVKEFVEWNEAQTMAKLVA